MRLEDKQNAIKLRKMGYSYKEIISAIPNLSKGTLNNWCKYIDLTPNQMKLLEKRVGAKMDTGRLNAALTNRRKRMEREKKISELARKEFERNKLDPFFTFGLALYCAEGTKKCRTFQFMNSDPALILMMVKWIEKYLKTDRMDIKIRLYAHKIYEHENPESFWAKTLNIPKTKFLRTVYKHTSHAIKKNYLYKGCLRLEICRVSVWFRVMKWIEFYLNNTSAPSSTG